MADKETKDDAIAEGNKPGMPDGDDGPGGTSPLPSPMVHRESHSPQTRAD